jgi:hypothetical protein
VAESSVDSAKSRFAEEDPFSRCELIAADLTQSVPAGADVYMLKQVLARASGRRGNHGSQELPRGPFAERQFHGTYPEAKG